jgi:HEPN domain
MNRSDVQRLARARIREARILLQKREYSGAYYLSGYSVECALKACIASKVRRYEFPDRDLAINSYTHNLEKLVGTAGLKQILESQYRANVHFAGNWGTIKDWNEVSRYEVKTRIQARDLYRAITNRHNGIFKWLRQHW